jgi:hypothetical protein
VREEKEKEEAKHHVHTVKEQAEEVVVEEEVVEEEATRSGGSVWATGRLCSAAPALSSDIAVWSCPMSFVPCLVLWCVSVMSAHRVSCVRIVYACGACSCVPACMGRVGQCRVCVGCVPGVEFEVVRVPCAVVCVLWCVLRVLCPLSVNVT